MQIKSIVAAAGAVLLATAGAAQADEVLTPTGGGEVERFSALLGVTAHPMSIEESAAIRAFAKSSRGWTGCI